MEITKDNIDLISKLIKSNRKFADNEDLFDDFLNETCRRSVTIIESINNPAVIESYLRKVVSTSIISVLKDSGRLRRSKSGYMSTHEVSLETVAPEGLVGEDVSASSLKDSVDYSLYSFNYSDVNLSISPEENVLHNEVVNFVADILEKINEEEPKKRYLDVFIMRYDKCLTQKQMAQELGISQSEVSKRIYGLLERVKSVLNER